MNNAKVFLPSLRTERLLNPECTIVMTHLHIDSLSAITANTSLIYGVSIYYYHTIYRIFPKYRDEIQAGIHTFKTMTELKLLRGGYLLISLKHTAARRERNPLRLNCGTFLQ